MRITKEYLDALIENGRSMLKPDWKLWDPKRTDQGKGIEPPDLAKVNDWENEPITLTKSQSGTKTLVECIKNRRSTRDFSDVYLTFDELSYLLMQTGGLGECHDGWSHRAIPSAGGRHCLETYLYINKVQNVQQGLYLYLPLEHKLVLINAKENLQSCINKAIFNQMHDSAVTFIWTAIPYRMEYRYTVVSHKMIAIEAGHACQNLYLASESIDCGCCAISAYQQELIDRLVKVDGDSEFVIYVAIVGNKED